MANFGTKHAPAESSSLTAKFQRSAAFMGAQSEDRLFKLLLGVSLLVHLGVLLTSGMSWQRDPVAIDDEWSMDADLVADADFESPAVTALPKAQIAPEAAVKPEILPQLTKKFAIEEPTKAEEIVPEAIDKPQEKPEPKKEELKQVEKPKVVEDLNLKKTDAQDNKIKQEEALKRLAMEKLRQENKVAEKTQAPEDDKLARVAQLLAEKRGKGGGALGTSRGASRYGSRLKAAVQRNYNLPEAYNLKGANVAVELAIVVNAEGNLVSIDVYKPSGDEAFDQLTIDAARASVPLPKPPPELVGQKIILSFIP